MIDQAGILMAQGSGIACERIQGVNDNMSQSHYHEYYEIYYLEAGERFHMVEDKLYKMEAGEFIIFPPYVMHHSYGAENMPFKRVLLYFSQEEILWPSILSELREEGGIYKVGIRERQEIHRAMELILKEQKNPGAYHEEYARGVLNMLLLLIAREERPEKAPERKSRIGEVIRYIHSHYQEEISLEMLAQMFYVSPYYLCREFKKSTNSTIVRYINVTRIMNAQRKFMETSKNITDISRETGFSNLTHFNRVFKSVTGMSPSQYRRQFVNKPITS
jgi:AraC-like DNA-binding protein